MDGQCRKSFIALLVVWSVLEHNGVHGNDIVVNCVAVSDMVPSTFGATLYKANLTSVCDLLNVSKVTYLLTYPTTATEALCEQQLSPCNTVQNADGCRCVSDAGDAYSFEFNFIFNKSKHEGSKLTLTTDCVSSIVGGLKSTSPCDLKASPTSPTSPGQESVLLWLLLLLLLLIPPLILILIFCCPCGNIACHWCCCTGRCYCRCADKAGTGCCGAAWCKKEDNFISHVCYLCGYKKVKEEEEFICCSLEKCEVVPTTRSGQRDNKVDADHVATNGAS